QRLGGRNCRLFFYCWEQGSFFCRANRRAMAARILCFSPFSDFLTCYPSPSPHFPPTFSQTNPSDPRPRSPWTVNKRSQPHNSKTRNKARLQKTNLWTAEPALRVSKGAPACAQHCK